MNVIFIHFFYYFQRFRSYIKALVSSIRLACCNPKRLLRRSYSRSSLDIGVIPFDQNLMKVEIHRRYERYTENARIKKAAACALFPTRKYMNHNVNTIGSREIQSDSKC